MFFFMGNTNSKLQVKLKRLWTDRRGVKELRLENWVRDGDGDRTYVWAVKSAVCRSGSQ